MAANDNDGGDHPAAIDAALIRIAEAIGISPASIFAPARRLTETLKSPATRLDASSDIRSLVGKIVLHPGDRRGEVHATLHGSLIGILDFVNDIPQPGGSRVLTKVSSGSRE
ncbi:hypothetical protein [Sphingopyxis sp.]|uniref:hypothetical protein n=1 Tax=Sphingopyxis sp. TaxID=1908224 RepID=UPI002ED911ED